MDPFYYGKGVMPGFLTELINRCFGNPLSEDPDTSTWCADEAGYGWFNTTEGVCKVWTGSRKAVISFDVYSVLSPQFAIDAVAVVSVTIPHGLGFVPSVECCQLTLVEDTDVDDFQIGWIKVESTDHNNVYAKVNVTNASATSDATAKLALRVSFG